MVRYALVIGIAQYQPSLKTLPKAVTDAELVAQVLEQYGDYKVIRLPGRRDADKNSFKMVDKTVSGAEVGKALKSLLQERADHSEVLIYYAGHGFTISDNLGRQKGFLAASDCQIEMVEKVPVEQKYGASVEKPKEKVAVEQKYGISLESLNQLIQESELSSLVLLLDCCHSGYFLESQLVQQTLTAFSSQKNYYLITACRSFENAKSFKGEPHAIFTGALLKGLSIENAGSKGRISGARLFDFISEELKNSAEQEPICLGWGRSITLVTYPQKEILLEPTPSSLAVHRENPYLGLRAFEDTEKDYFFGREIPVRVLLDRLKDGRFLAIIGPSGCGKSSLVKAGLLAKLKQNCLFGSSQWIVQSFTPGIHPLQELENALIEQQQDKQLLLFIDQFEELFTLCEDEEERKVFINRVTAEATSTARMTRIIVAMRGDFLDRCAAYPEIAILINRAQPTTYIVTPLTPAELEEVIEKPANKHGVQFEWGLVGQIIADVLNQPGALPLLQYALAELWRVCIAGSTSPEPQLTRECYEEIRGVRGALEKRANELYQNLAPADKYFVRRLFLELVQLGEEQAVTRRRATWQDLATIADSSEQLQRVTRQLASQQERLIITDDKSVEVAHEALLSEWKLLQGWIEQDRENLRLSRRLKSECQEWEKNACSDGLLLTDAWLAAITDWVEKTQPRLSVVEREFWQKSLDKREQEIQKQLANERELRELAEAREKEAEARALAEIEKAVEADARAKAEAEKVRETQRALKAVKQRNLGLSIAACGLMTIAFIAVGFWRQAESHKNQAIKALIQPPKRLFDAHNQLEAMVESLRTLKALKEIGGKNEDAVNQLKTEVIDKVREANRFQGHEEVINSVSFSPDGKTIASASKDKTVKLWSVEGNLLHTLSGHTKAVWRVRYSPASGNMIASASLDNTVKLWSADTGKLKTTLKGHTKGVADISFSPDSQTIATASWDGTIRLWDTRTGEELYKLENLTTENREIKSLDFAVESLDFAPDGITLVSGGYQDGSIKLWDLKTRSPKVLGRHQKPVNFVRFSKDGYLASGSDDGTRKLWKNGNLLDSIKVHGGFIYGLAFSADGTRLVSASSNGKINLFELRQNKLKIGEDLAAVKSGNVYEVSFNPNLNFEKSYYVFVSGGDDGSVRLWYFPKTNDNKKIDLDNLIIKVCDFVNFYLSENKKLESERNFCRRIQLNSLFNKNIH